MFDSHASRNLYLKVNWWKNHRKPSYFDYLYEKNSFKNFYFKNIISQMRNFELENTVV